MFCEPLWGDLEHVLFELEMLAWAFFFKNVKVAYRNLKKCIDLGFRFKLRVKNSFILLLISIFSVKKNH